MENNDYFSDDKIKKVLGLYYFAKFSRILMKYCNENINKNSKYIINIIDENKIDEKQDIIKMFLDSHFHDKSNTQNFDKYISDMNNLIIKVKKYLKYNIYKFIYSYISIDKIIKEGNITPTEFEKAGDFLISKFVAWKWYPAKENLYDDYLPKNKQYLKASFDDPKKINENLEFILNNKEDKNNIYDSNPKKNIEIKKDNTKLRLYVLYITYDFSYNIPRIWIKGYDYNNKPLIFDEIKDDINSNFILKNYSIEFQPFNGIKCFTIAPEGYALSLKEMSNNFE